VAGSEPSHSSTGKETRCIISNGNDLRLLKSRAKYDLRKFYRIVNRWNSLPNNVVLPESLNVFKSNHPSPQLYGRWMKYSQPNGQKLFKALRDSICNAEIKFQMVFVGLSCILLTFLSAYIFLYIQLLTSDEISNNDDRELTER